MCAPAYARVQSTLLIVGDKVYALDTTDKATLDHLDKLSDHQAKVTGEASGDSIAVLSVAEAK